MANTNRFFLYINFLVNGIGVGAYLTPMITMVALMDWGPIYEVFVPESLVLEAMNFIFMIAYYCFVIGPGAMFDGILMAGFGLSFNCCWLFLHVLVYMENIAYPRIVMATVPTFFLVSAIAVFWAIQVGYKADGRGRVTLIVAVLVTIVLSPSMSVANRLYSSVPDDNLAPFLIKMFLSILSVLTSAYGAWNGLQQNYQKDKNLKFLLIFSYVSIAIGVCQIVVRLIGPKFLSDHLRRIFIGMCNKVGRIGGCIYRRICGQRRQPTS